MTSDAQGIRPRGSQNLGMYALRKMVRECARQRLVTEGTNHSGRDRNSLIQVVVKE